MAIADRKIPGYLPNEVPPIGKMIILGFQHVGSIFQPCSLWLEWRQLWH